ncbi:hypothetical protein [Arenibaculum pallidiluteum]|uniref:hypothetical protein n=1 Tax=Arenibaculum pallidiluteum TaxID=2812559 RepID=UPI001A976115|nr:hypothetical protein [Arenibaculum pallidiluteum]
MKGASSWILGLLVLAGCARPGPPPVDYAELQRQNVLAQIGRMVQEPLSRFSAAPDCASADLQRAKAVARLNAETTKPVEHGLDAALYGADLALSVGDAARSHGCRDDALEMYDLVLGSYPGSAFAPLRARARAGIDDLRVAGGERRGGRGTALSDG